MKLSELKSTLSNLTKIEQMLESVQQNQQQLLALNQQHPLGPDLTQIALTLQDLSNSLNSLQLALRTQAETQGLQIQELIQVLRILETSINSPSSAPL